MEWVDLAIVLVLALAVLGGLSRGFFRSICSLVGLLVGLELAAWNYHRVATLISPLVRNEPVADTVGFLLVALFVMGLAGVAGSFLSKTLHGMGLGCLDRLAGAAFGFLQGALLVMLVILVSVAFFPRTRWLTEARLPKLFFGACHFSARMSPEDLADRVRLGLYMLEEESPRWLRPGKSGV